jgi:hypothetical protein
MPVIDVLGDSTPAHQTDLGGKRYVPIYGDKGLSVLIY